MQTGFIPSGRDVLTIRIDSYENRCPKGVLRSTQVEGDIAFNGAIDLLLRAEEIMDTTNSPQRNEEPRSFTPVCPVKSIEEPAAVSGKAKAKAVLHLNVMFRQNATWQGSLVWADKGQEARFRSVLELIHLLDSVFASEEG